MEGSTAFISFLYFHIIVLQSYVGVDSLLEPDFVSKWYDMIAQSGTDTTLLTIAHGLGETPLLVDVQVMVTSGDNKGYIFPGSGCRARDDDQPEGYGGIIYIYNEVYIKISSPIQANDNHLGRCVYTGKSPYWEGPYSTDAYTAKVRARAWKNSSLPPADFIKTGIFISAGGTGSYNHYEVAHDLGYYYPALVISRTRFPPYLETYPNYYSDSVGASMGMYDHSSTSNAFVVYGFNNKTIRIWAPTAETDYIFDGTDGWNFNIVKNGTLELYVWKDSSLPPTLTASFNLGRKRKSEELQQTALFKNNAGYMYLVRAWVQARSGVNAGFRFVGNGNLAYDEVETANGCSYGGLLYAYDDHSIRFWQPGPGNGTSNGALICIASGMGGGVNVQASTEGVAVYYSWDLETNASTTAYPASTTISSSNVTSTFSTDSSSYSTSSTSKSILSSSKVSSTSIVYINASPTILSSPRLFSSSPIPIPMPTTISTTDSSIIDIISSFSTDVAPSSIQPSKSPTVSTTSSELSTIEIISSESSKFTLSVSTNVPLTSIPSTITSTDSTTLSKKSSISTDVTPTSTFTIDSSSMIIKSAVSTYIEPTSIQPARTTITDLSTVSTISPSTIMFASTNNLPTPITSTTTTKKDLSKTITIEPETSTIRTISSVSEDISHTIMQSTTTTTTDLSNINTISPETLTINSISSVSTDITSTSKQSTTTRTMESSIIRTTSTTQPTTKVTSTIGSSESYKKSTPTLARTSALTSMSTPAIPDCGNPQEPEFGGVKFNRTTFGSVATYFCRDGYYIFGNNSAVCEANAEWTTLDTKCLPVDCNDLYLPISDSEEIKYIPKNSTIYGSVALLKCKHSFSLSNGNKSAAFICSENGNWTGNFSVTCTPISCGSPLVPNNAVISDSKPSYIVGSIVRYTCTDGYVLEGRSSRVCQSFGKWSGSIPRCNKAPQKQSNPCNAGLDKRKLFWNETGPGQISMIQCSEYYLKQNLSGDVSGEVTRKCSTEGKWLLPHYNCIRIELEEITEAANIIKDTPTADVVSKVLGQLSTFTNKTDSSSIYSGELNAVTSTLEVIASINYSEITIKDNQVTSFFSTTSNLLDTSNAESWQAMDDQPNSSEAPSGASKVLDVISSYTDAVSNSFNSTGGGNISVSFDNLLLEIRSLQVSEDIVFPQTKLVENVSSSLNLSKDSLKRSTTYSAVLYKNLTGLVSINASFQGGDIELGSSVMSVKLDNWNNVKDFKITLTFQHFEMGKDMRATCSYRNESGVLWGRDGCKFKHTNTTLTICECEHLTNFAILMSPWTEDNVETKAIRIVSIVGCSISMLCLIITIVTHMCYWKYVKSDRVKILMNLCLALLISYCIFLGGVDRTSNKDVCTTVAVFLQYIYLVVFFLMLAEGVEISFVVLYVFTTKSRLKWILPSAWLLPALIVGISLAVTQTKGYGNDKSCWLSLDDGLIWAFVGPALLIILINFILIVLVLKAVFRTKNLSQKSLRERTIVGVRCLCVLLPLVGCTWVLGIFYVNEDMAWIQYVFAVCNGLQGFAIFLFHCALNSQIKHAFERRRKFSSAATFTRSTSNPILIPRAKPSSSSSDLYQSINNSFGSETTFYRNRNVRERYQAVETLEMKRYPDTGYQYDELRHAN